MEAEEIAFLSINAETIFISKLNALKFISVCKRTW